MNTIGQIVLIRFEGVFVRCIIRDTRQAYGRTDLYVSPIDGAGRQWVADHRVKEDR